MKVIVNGKIYQIKSPKHKKLLWFLREDLKLYGTKYEVENKKITTIEGIPENHPVKKAWREIDVPQCGYCQSGQIMQAIELLSNNPQPSREEILNAMYGNLCRCRTYPRIIKAIELASGKIK